VGVIIYGEQTVAYDYIAISQPGADPVAEPYVRPASEESPVDEQFDDNSRSWPLEQSGTEMECRLKDGTYGVDRRKETGNYFVVRGPVDRSGEFTLESRLRKDKGDDGKVWVGLIWGLSSGADYCNILIRPNGQFALAVMDQGEYRRILDWR
jgi:hypothetical protein